jgi:ferredoxin-NADP reductase
MNPKILTLQSIEHITHDVLRIVTDKPHGTHFVPGQAAEISIDKPGWEKELRPFTFTCLPANHYLEFTIKTYPKHNGVTNMLRSLLPEDRLLLHDVFGAITYQGEGVFIAGGAGITPFISILRDLNDKNGIGNNKLIFANKTKGDIIIEDELHGLLGDAFINILSEETLEDYHHGMINKEFLQLQVQNMNALFYLCGPPPMMDAVEAQLMELGAQKDRIVKETF